MKFFFVYVLTGLFIIGCAVKKTPEIEVPATESMKKVPVSKPDYLWAFMPSVNVRQSARENAEKLTELKDGDSVAVLTNQNGWYEIRTDDKVNGWVRSDLLGPKNFSAFKRAVGFVDSLRQNDGTEIYFDKNLYHKRIYIHFPAAIYQSRARVTEATTSILKSYHKAVYRGDVSARVLQPDSESEFMTLDTGGEINADPLLPVVPFGILSQAHRRYEQGIALSYRVPDTISDQQLLKTARTLSSSYPLSYKRIEISFISSQSAAENECRLWFAEDSRGEEYKFNDCPEGFIAD